MRTVCGNTSSLGQTKSESTIAKENEPIPKARSAIFFEELLKVTRNELDSLCSKVTKDMETVENMPESITDDIRAVLGKTKLLTGKKLVKLEELIQINKSNNLSDSFTVTEDDLEAFWSLIRKELLDIFKQFCKIDLCRAVGWIPDEDYKMEKVTTTTSTTSIKQRRISAAPKTKEQKLKEEQAAKKRREMMKLAMDKSREEKLAEEARMREISE